MTPSKVGCLPRDDPFHRTALCLLMTPSTVTSLLTPQMVKSGYLRWVTRPHSSVCSGLPTTMESLGEQPSKLPPASGGYPLPHLSCLFYLTTGMVGAVLPLLLLLFLCSCSPWGPATLQREVQPEVQSEVQPEAQPEAQPEIQPEGWTSGWALGWASSHERVKGRVPRDFRLKVFS